MQARGRQPWTRVLALAGMASIVVGSCGGKSARDTGGDAASGAGGSHAGNRSTKPGMSGSGGDVADAGWSGVGGTTGARGGAPGRGGSQDGGGGSRVSGTGGSVAGNGASSGAGVGGRPANQSLHACGNQRRWSGEDAVELCDHGFVHRTQESSCPLPPHPEEGGAAGALDVADFARVECRSDTDCNPNEYCVLAFDGPDQERAYEQETQCRSACVTNDDCASGEVCSCNPTFISAITGRALTLGVCTRAGCHTDADCPNGTLCVASLVPDPLFSGCESQILLLDEFQCQSERDECSGPGDCPPAKFDYGGFSCPYEAEQRTCHDNSVRWSEC